MSGSDVSRPFLIAGHPRSGTTILTRLLNTHPRVGATYELGAFRGLNRSYSEYLRGLRLGFRDWPVLHIGSGTPRRRRWASRCFLARFRYGLWRRRRSKVTLEAVTYLLGRGLNRPLVGDKLPRYVFELDDLARFDGLARIVIVRDCLPVVASTLHRVRTAWREQPWTERVDTPEKVAHNWVRAIESVERNHRQVHALRYEDLIREPRVSLEDVAKYLDVRPGGFDAGLIRPRESKQRTMLSGEDVEAVLAVAGETMRRWGYGDA